MVGITTVVNQSVIIHHILDTKQRLIAQTVVIHYESITGVKGVDFKRGVIILTDCFIGKYHAEGRTTDMKPVCQFLILCGFLFGKNKFVKLIDCVCNILSVTTGYIL